MSAFGTAFWLIVGSLTIVYIATHPPRRRMRHTPAEFGAEFENVQFPSRDGGTLLSGWFVPARSAEPRGVVVLCHGMAANRGEMLPWAEALWENDFAMLLFDFRGAGRSEGNRCSAGYHEQCDLQGAIDYLTARPDTSELPLGVFGFSMGGATAILTAADENRIRAVATHGAFATLEGAIRQRCRHHFGFLAPLALKIMMTWGNYRHWFAIHPSAVKPLSVISRIQGRPLLLIHGEHDKIVPARHAHDLYAAAGHPKSLEMLPRSRHRRIHKTLQDDVRARLAQFFRDSLTLPL